MDRGLNRSWSFLRRRGGVTLAKGVDPWNDIDLHDHDRPLLTFVLTNGYIEGRHAGDDRRETRLAHPPFTLNRLGRHCPHRVIGYFDPTRPMWTLTFSGPRKDQIPDAS